MLLRCDVSAIETTNNGSSEKMQFTVGPSLSYLERPGQASQDDFSAEAVPTRKKEEESDHDRTQEPRIEPTDVTRHHGNNQLMESTSILKDIEYTLYLDTTSLSLLNTIQHPADFIHNKQTQLGHSGLPPSEPLPRKASLHSHTNLPSIHHVVNNGNYEVPSIDERDRNKQLPPQRTHLLLLLGVPVAVTPSLLYLMFDLAQYQGDEWTVDSNKVRQVRVLKRTPCEFDEPVDLNIDFYSILFVFASQKFADDFFWKFHGAYFDRLMTTTISRYPKELIETLTLFTLPSKDRYLFGCCYFVHISSVSYVTKLESVNQELIPPDVPFSICSVVPVCPVCLERVDVSVFGIVTRSTGWMAVCPENLRCLSSCRTCRNVLFVQERLSHGITQLYSTSPKELTQEMTHCSPRESQSGLGPEMESQPNEQPILKNGKNRSSLRLVDSGKCSSCSDLTESWICLICGHVGCGRYKQKHAKEHSVQFHHRICFQVFTSHIWNYESEVFVHRRILPQQQSDKLFYVIGLPHPASSSESRSQLLASYHPNCIGKRRRRPMNHSRAKSDDEVNYYQDDPRSESIDDCLSHSDEGATKLVQAEKKKKMYQNPLDEYCKELEVILSSQLEFQRTLHGQKMRDFESKHWSKLQSLLSTGEQLQLEMTELRKVLSDLKGKRMSQQKRNKKLERRLSVKSVEMSELKSLNEALLLCFRGGLTQNGSLSNSPLLTSPLVTIKNSLAQESIGQRDIYSRPELQQQQQQQEEEEEERLRILDCQIMSLQNEASELMRHLS